MATSSSLRLTRLLRLRPTASTSLSQSTQSLSRNSSRFLVQCQQQQLQQLQHRSYATSHAAAPPASGSAKHGAVSSSGAASHDSHGHDGHGHGHDSHYDPPSGWLWGIRPGEKYEKEGWEGVMTWMYIVPVILATIVYVNKEDTTIQTWALEEARRRLEKEGLLSAESTK